MKKKVTRQKHPKTSKAEPRGDKFSFVSRIFFSKRKVLTEENIMLSMLALSTAFFFYQHFLNFSWDFSSYSLNAQYWLGNSSYFEYYRPPLISFFLVIFGILGAAFSEYAFILGVSIFFLYTTIQLADALKVDRILFYFASLSPYMLLHGLINGTELLSLAFLELFLVALIERKSNAGFYLGLAFLTRFNMAIFSVLLLTRNFRALIKNAIAFGTPIIAWLLFTFFTTGNSFTTIADTYAIIFKFRDAFQPVNLGHLWFVTMFFMPFFLYGLWLSAKRIAPNFHKGYNWLFVKERRILVVIAVTLLALYQYYVNPIKDIRYVFTLVVPVAYFSVIALTEVKRIIPKLFVTSLVMLIVINIFFVGAYVETNNYESTRKYEYAIERVNGLSIGHCRTMSNGWVFLNYLGKTTEPTPDPRLIQNKLDDGNILLLFRSVEEPGWVRNYPFVHQFPVIFEDDEIIVIGKQGACVPTKIVNSTYVERLANTVSIVKGITINTNPCFTLFSRIELLEKTCNLVNLRGFVIDENRYDAARLEGY